MNSRHRKDPRKARDAGGEAPEFTTEEVDRLTRRAEDLLGQLHEVLKEMSEHLQSVGGGGEP
jgi:hypothetical protein